MFIFNAIKNRNILILTYIKIILLDIKIGTNYKFLSICNNFNNHHFEEKSRNRRNISCSTMDVKSTTLKEFVLHFLYEWFIYKWRYSASPLRQQLWNSFPTFFSFINIRKIDIVSIQLCNAQFEKFKLKFLLLLYDIHVGLLCFWHYGL